MAKQFVLMDHDGAIDDFLATILLATMAEVELLGVVVTPADCYIRAAVNVTRKIFDLMGRTDVPVAESTVRGLNSFPPSFRRDSVIIDHFPLLNEREQLATPLVEGSGQSFMNRLLQEAFLPITLMVTGPLTTVAWALEQSPELERKIERIIWMGGALKVPGNVEKEFALEHDGSAEWNAFWDPIAVERVWQTQIPIILCPLDITNTVPVTPQFVKRLAKQRRYPLADLAGLCYSLAIPQNYYCWDVLATAYLGCPELYQLGEQETAIVTTGASQGRTLIQPDGRRVKVIEDVDRDRFYDYLLQQFLSD